MPSSRTLDDLPVLSSLSSSDIFHVRHSGTDNKLTKLALFTSPDLTGIPTAPTADDGTNTTQIATTAFVLANGGGGGGSVAWGDITGTLSDQTDLGTLAALNLDTDVTMAANSDSVVPSQKAVVAYVGANSGGSPAWGDITGTLDDQSDLSTELAMVGGYMGCWNFTYTSADPAGTTGAATFDGFSSPTTPGSVKLYYVDADGFSWQGDWGSNLELPQIGSLIGLRSKGSGAAQYGVYKVNAVSYTEPFLNVSMDTVIVNGFTAGSAGTEIGVSFLPSNDQLVTQSQIDSWVIADSGWTANDDAGSKTAAIPTAASVAGGRGFLLAAVDPGSINGVNDYLTYLDRAVEKIKAIEASLASTPPVRPNA